MKGYIYSASARLISMTSQFLLIAAIGNFGNIELVGFWGPFASFILISSICLNYGQSAASYIKIPPLVKAKQIDEAHLTTRNILLKNMRYGLMLTPLIAIGAYVTFSSIELSLWITLTAFLFSFGETSAALFRSFNRIAISELVKNGIWRILVLSALTLFFIIGLTLDQSVITRILVGAAILQAFVLYLYYSSRLKSLSKTPYVKTNIDTEIDRRNWMIQSFQSLTQNLDVILVAVIFTPVETAIYFLATRLTSIISLPLSVTNPVITPIFSLIAKNGQSPDLVNRVRRNTLLNVASAMILFSFLFFNADTIASFLAGKTVSIQSMFLILAIGQTINVSVGPTMQVAQLFNFRRHTMVLQFVSLAIILISALVAYRTQSVIAFAVGVTVGRVVLNLGIVTLLAVVEKTNIFTGRKRDTSLSAL